jgi:hypothetical protein
MADGPVSNSSAAMLDDPHAVADNRNGVSRLGRLESLSSDGRLSVLLDGSIVVARIGISDSNASIIDAIRRRAEVVVQSFEGRPVVVALVRDRLDAGDRVEPPGTPRRLELRASENIALVCGHARLELSADGDVSLNGEYIRILAQGSVRVDGADIKLN